MRFAMVDANNTVVNIIEMDPEHPITIPGHIFVPAPEAGSIGDNYRDGEFISPPPPPMPPPPLLPISHRQFYQTLAMEGVISQQEALAAVQTGQIPEMLSHLIKLLPSEDDKFAARMLLSGASTFDRYHPLVNRFMEALQWKPEQVDEMWRKAMTL